MATTTHTIEATPDDVFAVLSDPRGYAYWVLGSKEIRDADRDWPAAGSRFHHTVGFGPLRLQDHTSVEEVEQGRFLQLRTKARPLGVARVKLRLAPMDGGTEVTMIEQPADAGTAFVFNPLTHLLTDRRNVRSLERLAELAEGRVPMPGEEPGAPVRYAREGDGAVQNPAERDRAGRGTSTALIAALVGGLAGSIALVAWSRKRG